MRVAIYTRLSSDPDGTSTATARQEADCRELAASKGWDVLEVFEDNDVSAFNRSVRRPRFEKLLLEVANGSYDVVMAWKSDRLARQPRDLERFLDACEAGGCDFVSVTEPEFQSQVGKFILRMLVGFGNYESSVKSERVKRAIAEIAFSGRMLHSGFGYDREGNIVEEEAVWIRRAAERLIAGDSISSVASYLNENRVLTRPGNPWSITTLRRMLSAPRLAGLVQHQGEILQGIKGGWEPILDEATWMRLQSSVRRPPKMRGERYLLSGGLMRCGSCGGKMLGGGSGVKKQLERYPTVDPRMYCCTSCRHVSIRRTVVETAVSGRVLELLMASLALERVPVEADDRTNELLHQIRVDEDFLAQLAKDHYVERILSRAEFMSAREELEARIEDARRQIASAPTDAAARFLPQDPSLIEATFQRLPMPQQRAVIDAFVARIDIDPARHNPRLGEQRVRITWRS